MCFCYVSYISLIILSKHLFIKLYLYSSLSTPIRISALCPTMFASLIYSHRYFYHHLQTFIYSSTFLSSTNIYSLSPHYLPKSSSFLSKTKSALISHVFTLLPIPLLYNVIPSLLPIPPLSLLPFSPPHPTSQPLLSLSPLLLPSPSLLPFSPQLLSSLSLLIPFSAVTLSY